MEPTPTPAAPIAEPAPMPPTAGPVIPTESKSSKRIPILIIIIVLILAGVGGYMYITNKQQSEQKAAAQAQSSEKLTTLENDLSNDSEGSDSADFQQLNTDLQTL